MKYRRYELAKFNPCTLGAAHFTENDGLRHEFDIKKQTTFIDETVTIAAILKSR